MEQSLVDIICETIGKQGYIDCLAFRSAMLRIRFRKLSHDDIEKLKMIYSEYPNQYCRNQILIALVMQTDESLKGFFRKTCFSETQISFKLIAIRGYAQYASEKEVSTLTEHFMKKLKEECTGSPYDCEQLTVLRSEFCLPYLVNEYGYSCFCVAQEEVEHRYEAMPQSYKGLFEQDQFGQYVPLMTQQELSVRIRRMMTESDAQQ